MDKIKYPRTKHLPWSTASTKDDRYLQDTSCFVSKKVVVTVKYDGQNTTLYADGSFHNRSIDSKADSSTDWLHDWWASKIYNYNFVLVLQKYPAIRFCAENLYHKHTIHYENLKAELLIHSIWNDDICLSWEDTESICWLLDLYTVPILNRGLYSERVIRQFDSLSEWQGDTMEGYVVRNYQAFGYDDFASNVAKYIRPDFKIQGDHWMQQERVKNVITS